MISKQEYRKYLLKQMADDKARKQREKEERMGVSRAQFPKTQDKPAFIETRNNQRRQQQEQVRQFYKPTSNKRPTYLGVTKEFNIQIGSSSAYQSQETTPEVVYQKYPSKYQTQSHSQQSDNVRSEIERPLSPRQTNGVLGRGRNLLAMQNVDPHKMIQRERKKSQMQRFLLQQMNQRTNNKTLEKKKKIEQQRKLQQQIERYGVFEGEDYGRRRGKKMVTMQAYFPETKSNKRSESEQQSTKKEYYSKALSEQKNVIQGYSNKSTKQNFQSNYNQYGSEANRFMTETREQFAQCPPFPSIKQIPVKQQLSYKDSLERVEQVSSPRRSTHSKANSQYVPPSQSNIPPSPSVPHKTVNPGYTYKMNMQSSTHNLQASSKQSEKQSQVETVNQQRYDRIGQELKKVREQILVQREMMAQSLARVNLQSQNKLNYESKPNYEYHKQRQIISSKHLSNKPSQKHIELPKIKTSHQTNHQQNYQPIDPLLDQSELFCQSKRIPIMSKQGEQTLTMSRIDDFALGENSFQRHIEQPSFMSKNQFIDPTLKRQQSRNNRMQKQMEAISQSAFGDNNSEKHQTFSRQKYKTNKGSSNYKVYYQTDD